MSAAAARRRKQLAARQNDQDVVGTQLKNILAKEETISEETAYEALQLAQSAIRRKVKEGSFVEACNLAYSTSLSLLKKGRVSVASQLLTLLVGVLRETHTEETAEWINRLVELHEAHAKAMETMPIGQESTRLQRLQRVWLASALQWSAELGNIRFGNNKLQEILGDHCWKVSKMDHPVDGDEEEDEVADLQCDAVQYLALAEKPSSIIALLKSLPAPTAEETAAGHTCPPALRDALLTRVVLLLCAVENLRDANTLLRSYIAEVEERDIQELTTLYTKKESGQAPSHLIFSSMLVRICEKDARTGPLFQWLMRSFKRELDRLHKPQEIVSYSSKIGKIYFNIQPPPSMLNMMENMMGGMGGMGGGGMNPAMMQAALAQLQGM
jgi:Golgi to ER traffic protein 4